MSSQPNTVEKTSQGPKVGPYIFGKTLGTGSTGKVKLAKHCETGQYVAIKIVRKDFLAKKHSLKKKMQREITVMKLVDHPNVLKLLDVFEIDTHLFLVMEFVDGCELFEYLVRRRGGLPNDEALDFFQQIICGLEYCHNRLICHRDLKPENLLLSARNRTLLIADFGMTSLNRPGSLLETSCGSPHYCSPSVISGEPYDGLKADIWSCGVILYAMLTGRLPFDVDDDNMQRLLLKVQSGRYRIPPDVPPDAQSLIKAMLVVDPEQRITIEEIKRHPWFTRRPPRNYPPDDFKLPREPITTPDMRVVQGLVDLGWGDKGSIVKSLADTEPNLEQVCYWQLERHSSFHKGAPKQLRNAGDKDETHTISVKFANVSITKPNGDKQRWIPNRPGSRVKNEDEERSDEVKANRTDNVRPSNNTLVRQTRLARNAADEDGQKIEEAIESAASQNGKSWFETMRCYLTGGAQQEENTKESVKPRSNDTRGDEKGSLGNTN